MSAALPHLVPTDAEPTFGERLRSAREAVGLSQRAAALAFGIDRSAIRQWEHDICLVAPARMPYIEDALHLEEHCAQHAEARGLLRAVGVR